MSDEIKFSCEKCGQSVKVDSIHTGSSLHCPGCGQLLTVPGTQSDTNGIAFQNEQPAAAHTPGELIAKRYRLERILGQGGMGVVWLAKDEQLNEPVALKFVPPEIRRDKDALKDLRRETQKSRKLSHPNIIRIHDLNQTEAADPFISMEFVAGQTMSALCNQQPNGVFTWEMLRPLAMQLCSALEYAHSQGIVHRDLKPANLMCTERGEVKLADFGISASLTDTMNRVSLDNLSSGTPSYMSPQQIQGGMPSVRDDVYALGATLYALLTSKPPFFRGKVIYQVLHVAPATPEERFKEFGLTNAIPPEISAAIMACLVKDPEQRLPSVAAVAQALGLAPGTGAPPVQIAVPTPSDTPPAPSKTWRPLVAYGLGLSAALVLVTGGWLFQQFRSKKVEVPKATEPRVVATPEAKPGPKAQVPQPSTPEAKATAPLATNRRLDWTGSALRRAGMKENTITRALTQGGTVVAWGRNGDGQTTVPAGLSGVVAIAAGANYTVALKSDGTVVAWGGNNHGQTNVPAGLSGVVAIAAGERHTVALKSDGTVVAWGRSSEGQTTVPAGLSGVVAIAAGGGFTVALKSDGTVVDSNNKFHGATLSGVTAIAACGNFTVALKSNGTVVALGWNDHGQTTVPAGLRGVVAIAAGGAHTVALKSDGTVVAWGAGTDASLQNSTHLGQSVVPAGLSGVVAIAAGYNHTVALKLDDITPEAKPGPKAQVPQPSTPEAKATAPLATNRRLDWTGSALRRAGMKQDTITRALTQGGTVVAWGGNGAGQINVPAGLSGVVAIAAGDSHTVALRTNGTVVAWGHNGSGRTTVPAGLSGVVAIAANYNHTVALKSDGTVVAWGENGHGQTTVPAGLSGVVAIAAGGASHTVALKSDGTVVAWGANHYGQTTVPAGLSGVVAVAVGSVHTVALKSDGTVVAWGRNNEGQTTVPAGLSGVVAIAAGSSHTVALKSDGTVVAWGRNNEGQTTVPAGLSGVVAIAAGGRHTVALKSDGTVVAWGAGGLGQTGYLHYGQSTVPAGLSGVVAIAAGGHHTVALKLD
ncbi:MAG: hypothetical protein FJ392_09240 [Verrucomicrobia bacterium]|nr:hypothetical protein [Verrucomicrobiota bacterium]